jgi:hypothetical protein
MVGGPLRPMQRDRKKPEIRFYLEIGNPGSAIGVAASVINILHGI